MMGTNRDYIAAFDLDVYDYSMISESRSLSD